MTSPASETSSAIPPARTTSAPGWRTALVRALTTTASSDTIPSHQQGPDHSLPVQSLSPSEYRALTTTASTLFHHINKDQIIPFLSNHSHQANTGRYSRLE
ncbi:hypothetical protein MJO28_006532 [Puccinia striiformis f. sp. tritici]|uniref:Uncharacterized protein n=2 Tax=Puccinia striiformis TaxID=27350 RepID=A0A2S4UAH2_9BASI|nr:hypothetical protein MJO28_006532 [Puccinia striiformis f. sp. tritici]POV94275.1 hypothetical protein PSTT_16937 [Puccinia striiformis]